MIHTKYPIRYFEEIALGEVTKHTVTCVAVIRDDFKKSTINLKCPIFINLENNLAKQIILEDSDSLHALPHFRKGGLVMLILTRKQGEAFLIGDNIEISIAEINGDKVRIAIDAPREVKVLRKELKDAGELNKEAASAASSRESLSNLAVLFKDKK